MLTLGIDPGIATTGFGLIKESDAKLNLIDYGIITTEPSSQTEKRLSKLYRELKNLINEYKPQCVAIEKLFFGVNAKSAMAVGQARGIILLSSAEMRVPVFEYTPIEVKIAVAGYGKAGKIDVQKMVKALLSMDRVPKPDDAADALAIAICHAHSYKMKRRELML
ncbi:MAG: crossover junction endodeoxyribonuclease RuvC [Candidatus Saganbacteria bacterium]|nr:crossover junction endodeoxyribonuclease RuvC [Candidatus Saganbacteria bacterium]